MKLVMDYQQRPIYDVIAKLHGSDRTTNGLCSAIITTRGFLARPIPAAAQPRCSKRRARWANSFAPDGNRDARS